MKQKTINKINNIGLGVLITEILLTFLLVGLGGI